EKDKVKYKGLRNEVVNMIRNSESLYYEQCIDNNKSNPDKLWKNLKQLICDKKNDNSDALKEISFNGLLCIDFSKAFETINRAKLLNTLEALGIAGTVKDWFSSYLSNRKQKVQYRNTVSDQIDIDVGVPQGSKLGTVLFLLYINNVVKLFDKSGVVCRLFADDMALYFSSRYYQILESKLNRVLTLLNSWL
ncbi:GSCOCG00012547001-RA-CDS, partial [Cotesia congregata]